MVQISPLKIITGAPKFGHLALLTSLLLTLANIFRMGSTPSSLTLKICFPVSAINIFTRGHALNDDLHLLLREFTLLSQPRLLCSTAPARGCVIPTSSGFGFHCPKAVRKLEFSVWKGLLLRKGFCCWTRRQRSHKVGCLPKQPRTGMFCLIGSH